MSSNLKANTKTTCFKLARRFKTATLVCEKQLQNSFHVNKFNCYKKKEEKQLFSKLRLIFI